MTDGVVWNFLIEELVIRVKCGKEVLTKRDLDKEEEEEKEMRGTEDHVSIVGYEE